MKFNFIRGRSANDRPSADIAPNNFGHQVSVRLLGQFPNVTCHFETRKQLGVSWLEVHHCAQATGPVGDVEFRPCLDEPIVSVLLDLRTSLHHVRVRDLRCRGSAAARTHIQGRNAATRSGDQMKRKGIARKEFDMTSAPMIDHDGIAETTIPQTDASKHFSMARRGYAQRNW